MGEPLITRLLVENLATILAITGIIGFVALGPIGRALARRIEGRDHDDAELAELGARLARLEQQARRTSELEERVDFTERLLARDRDAARLPARGEG